MPPAPPSNAPYKGKSAGRLAAVQALFQLEYGGGSASSIILEFLEHRLKNRREFPKSGIPFFRKLVEGAWAEHTENDEIITGALKSGWSLERIEPVTRAILRAALFELRHTKTPSPVILDEYLNITHSFFEKDEASFVNGILNTIAQKIRVSEGG